MNPNLMYTPQEIPGQTQQEPGKESEMYPQPIYDDVNCKGYNRLKGKTAIITGGDSGIGRAVAVAYAKEGCNVSIVYNIADDDANETKSVIENYGGTAFLIKGNLKDSNFCKEVVEKTVKQFGGLDIIVNNAAIQKGNKDLIDYSATKGAVTAFTRSLSQNLADKKIRVNQIAPGPIWTPLIPSTFDKLKVGTFGKNTPLKRPGQPVELAEAYVFLASEGSTYMTGQTLHINGGDIVNG
ncbi:MAG: ydaD 1 [Clostridiales bacterium]|nr:ydaD 1 [Clostridiales bacterium]